jgi:hypothetical protein
MEEKLEKISENINKWLSFAEAKNAAIIAFNGGAIFGLFKMAPQNSEFNNLHPAMYLFLIFLFISLYISLSSFTAKLNPEKFNKLENISNDDNLLFYGHICKYNSETYLEKIFIRYGECREPSKYEKDLANQIVINSKIAVEKYKKFNCSLKCILLGIIAFIINLIYIRFGLNASAIVLNILIILWVLNYLKN